MSGFKTQLQKRGNYQSLNTDNHKAIISKYWLGISSWFLYGRVDASIQYPF